MRRRLCMVLFTVVSLVATLTFRDTAQAQQLSAVPTSVVDSFGKRLSLAWSDEFSGAANAPVDSTKWFYNTGGNGWGNGQLDYDTASVANVRQDGIGHLAILARKDNVAGLTCWYGPCTVTSGRIFTQYKFEQAYGRFEARIRIPAGAGLWPAFWMLGGTSGTDCSDGEIDVEETIGSQPATNWGSLHGPGYCAPPEQNVTGSYTLPAGESFATAYHTFAVDWSSTAIDWLIDGQVVERRTPADLGGNPWVFDHPFFMILDLAVGGSWPGSPTSATHFPAVMWVDYVRAYG